MNVALRPQPINLLSICTGGGGLDLAVELAIPGARSVCMVEREAYAVAQLVAAMQAGHLAPAPIWSDARTFDGRPWRGLVDGFVAGIPCQPHSFAGKKRGALDERDLWGTARRNIVQARPWFALIENVGGMLSAGADEISGADRVRRDLSKLGYTVEGGLFTAAEVGWPQERERIFILGVADTQRNGWGEGEFGASIFQGPAELDQGSNGVVAIPRLRGWQGGEPAGVAGSAGQGSAAERGSGALVDTTSIGRREGRAEPVLSDRNGSATPFAGTPPPRPDDTHGWRRVLSRSPELEPSFRRVANGVASPLDIARIDRLRLLGNGVHPLQGAYAFRALATRLARRGSPGAAILAGVDHG